MSDLISRSALLEIIENMNFDFGNDSDDTETIIEMVSEAVNNQPTAYDVDKVVEQLEEEEMPLEDNDGNYVLCVVVPTRVAEMIIRAGGKE